jgi:Uma2 family endonuclease
MAMSTQQDERFTREEYLAREEVAEYKSEYYDGEIVAMAGGTYNHSAICFNLIRRVGEGLDGKDCVGFDSNMKLDIPAYIYLSILISW